MKTRNSGRADPGRDNIARLKNIAFWLWQYQSRNYLYESYCKAICAYIDYFMEIGEISLFKSIDITKVTMLSDHEAVAIGIKNMPIVDYFYHKHGNKGKRTVIKFHYLCKAFYRKFGRHAKFAFDRIDTSACLFQLLSGDEYTFITEDPGDIASVLRLYNNWHIKSHDGSPNSGVSILNRENDISFSAGALVHDSNIIGLEADSIQLFFKAAQSFWNKIELNDKILKSSYKLCISGDRVKSTDTWRLCGLWMWDKAHADGVKNPLEFKVVYTSLKDEIEKAYLEDGIWDQIITRKNRVRKCYEITARCISEMTVLPLQL